MVLVNTEKGRFLYEQIAHAVSSIEAELKRALQPNLQAPSRTSSKRYKFEKDYVRKGFSYVAKKYGSLGFSYQIQKKFPIIGKIRWNITNRILNKIWKRKE